MNQFHFGKILAVFVAILGIASIVYWIGIRSEALIFRSLPALPVAELPGGAEVRPGQMIQEADSDVETASFDWSAAQFDACGGKSKYDQLPWWNAFAERVAQVNYYSSAYIEYQLKAASENEYSNPSKKQYTYETYCADQNYSDASICGGNKRKVSIDDFTDSGEGCLSTDGMGFIAVFPGEYMGGGSYVFRYDIKNDTVEAAQRLNERQAYGSFWIDPPTAFGKRQGTIVEMTGGGGDAGCGSKTEFAYDIVANTVKMTQRCTACDQEQPVCTLY